MDVGQTVASPWLTTAFFTGSVSLAIFAANIVYRSVQSFVQERMERRKFVTSLHTEVLYNVDDLQRFIDTAVSSAVLRAAFEAGDQRRQPLIPHITDARHTAIYRSGIDRLHIFRNRTIRNIVEFYATLEKIKAQIDGLQFKSYETISIDGKIKTIEQIVEKTNRACKVGRKILRSLETEFPLDWDLAERSRTAGTLYQQDA